MPYLHNDVYDLGLSVLTDDAGRLDICSQEPSTYAQATNTYSLGNAAVSSVSAPQDGTPNGRQVTVAEIASPGGSVTGTGTAGFWALVDEGSSRLLAAGPLASSQPVTTGNSFTMGSFTLRIPAPA